MPVTIKHPKLEAKLALLGRANPVPASKRALTLAILNAAVDAARKRGVTIGRIITELRTTGRSTAAKPRRRKRATKQ